MTEQMDLFDLIEVSNDTHVVVSNETEEVTLETHEIKLHDFVKINVKDSDEEAQMYFKYYYPHVLNKTGEVVEIQQLQNKTLYLVSVQGEKHWFYREELVLL